MKYIISESRLDKFIYEYLNNSILPDYGFSEPEHYKNDVERWGYYDFKINDEIAYTYILKPLNSISVAPKTILIEGWLEKQLDDLFGNNWDRVFIKWFSNNTGLPVEHINVE
jgi:hypothetical protein